MCWGCVDEVLGHGWGCIQNVFGMCWASLAFVGDGYLEITVIEYCFVLTKLRLSCIESQRAGSFDAIKCLTNL